MTTFKQLGLSDPLLKVLTELGFETPTGIQEESIPQLLSGTRDMIGLAQTGTGKTAAFGLPLLDNIEPSNSATQGLILAPTRELGKQIAEQLEIFSKYMDRVNVLAVYGGAPIMNQIKALRKGTQIIIATPGRLIDLINRKAVKLGELKYLVLDEADEMLNMGFKEDIDTILSYTPQDKQTWLFSATMPRQIKSIVDRYMDKPIEVKINSKEAVNVNIEHLYSIVNRSNKTEALTRFLDMDEGMRGVVFCRTRRDTQDLAEHLMKRGYMADALHGDLSQAQRDRVMGRFKKKALQVLIATDVAARGIDVNDLTHVFHFTLPDETAYYTHRSGRTARAGKKGTSISFVNGRESHRIKRLERELNIEIAQVKVPNTKDIKTVRMMAWSKQVNDVVIDGIDDSELSKMVKQEFSELSKDDIINKLIAMKLKDLNLDSAGELNEFSTSHGGRGRGRDDDRRSSGGRRNNSRFRGSGGGKRSGGRGGRGGRGGSSDRSRDSKDSGSSGGRSRRKPTDKAGKKKKYFSK